jgi:hypothetical protein
MVVGLYFSGLPRPEYMPGTGEWWMDDKALVKKKINKSWDSCAYPVVAFSSYRHLKKNAFDRFAKTCNY